MTEPMPSDEALRALYREWDREIDYEREAARLVDRLDSRTSNKTSVLAVLAIAAGVVVVGLVAWSVVTGNRGASPGPARPQDPLVPRRADLLLPVGPAATPASALDDPVFVDVTHDGRVEYDGKAWYSEKDDGRDLTGMLHLLLYLKELPLRASRRIARYEVAGRTTGRALVDGPLVIRADRSAEWSLIANLIAQCEKPEATIWNVHLAVATPELGVFSVALPLDPADRLFAADDGQYLPIRIVVEQTGEPSEHDLGGASVELPETRRRGVDLVGHSIRWDIGPKSFTNAAGVLAELRRIYSDPASFLTDPKTGDVHPLPIAVQVGPRGIYSDVIETLEAITRAYDACNRTEPLRVVVRPMR